MTGVAANGDISFTLIYGDTSLGSDGDQAVSSTIQGVLGQMKGLKTNIVMSNRGITRSMDMDLTKIGNPQLSQIMGSFSNQMTNLSMPLPEEEVGPGARWEVRSGITAAGITMFQRAEYRLVSIDGKTVTVEVKVEQKAPPQPFSNPMLPTEVAVQLQGVAGSGTGTAAIHLDGITPAGTMSITTDQTMDMSMGGNTQTMTSRTTAKMTTTVKK